MNHKNSNNDSTVKRRNGVSSSSAPLLNQTSTSHTEVKKYSTEGGIDLNVDEVPDFLKESFIKYGYRYRLTLFQCFKSMFVMHNETVNIWTALIPLTILISLWIYTAWLCTDISFGSRSVFLVFLTGAIHSFLASTLFHLFGSARSSSWHTILIRFDFSGIASLIATSFYPPVYYIFYCQPAIRTFYLSVISILAAIGAALIMVPGNHRQLKPVRVLVLVATALFGVIPAIHFILSCGVPDPLYQQVRYIVGMYVTYGVGLVFYGTKIPERWRPGTFDYWGHSHQLWHVFVTAATFLHLMGCLHARDLHRRYGCFQSIGASEY
eukprot:gb/GECH01006338.1/.p1 GENE.gb/GECH01006338.1/~~gb/GECH01006338.1/.p1  ORF type:complete len:323 (+),score=55.54 gb/GECH01006338.1/:1-969(+)